MDQTTFAGLFQAYQDSCRGTQQLPDLTVSAGRYDAPIVLLIHGIGGNVQHWTDPVGLNPNDTWLFDLSATPTQRRGLAMSPPYQRDQITPWGDFLRGQEISWVTWSQAQANDRIEYAVAEAVRVLSALEQGVFAPYRDDVAINGGTVPPLIILCHSRGGLVARGALKQVGGVGVPHLVRVITLCTPHQGSYMPQLAAAYNGLLKNELDFSTLGDNLPGPLRAMFERRLESGVASLANQVRNALSHSFGTLAQSPGFDELAPDSAMLRALMDGEQPLPGVEYVAFGGSQPTFVHFYLCEAGRAFHLLATASAFLVEQLSRIPGVGSAFGGLAELSLGDSAVSLTSSHWPEAFGANHQVASVNHMQALVDSSLQQAVRRLL